MFKVFATILAFVSLLSVAAQAEDYVLTIKNHKFEPQELTIPADQKVKLVIKNMDSTPAEFESSDLSREKVVAPSATISVFVGPVSAGKYAFFDDFHRDTTTGTLIAQ